MQIIYYVTPSPHYWKKTGEKCNALLTNNKNSAKFYLQLDLKRKII